MLKRMKQVLVESYIGAIALGYLLAQVILQFVAVFSAPVASWAQQRTVLLWTSQISRSGPPPSLQFQEGLPRLVDFLLLLLFWYILLRWLYLEKPAKQTSAPASTPDQ